MSNNAFQLNAIENHPVSHQSQICFSIMDRTIQFHTWIRSVSAQWTEPSSFTPLSGLFQHHGQNHIWLCRTISQWTETADYFHLISCPFTCDGKFIVNLSPSPCVVCVHTLALALGFELNSRVCACVCFSTLTFWHTSKRWVNQNRRIRQCGLVTHGVTQNLHVPVHFIYY